LTRAGSFRCAFRSGWRRQGALEFAEEAFDEVTGLWPAILADTGATVLVTANALRLLGYRPADGTKESA
jgi:hypothetical protein